MVLLSCVLDRGHITIFFCAEVLYANDFGTPVESHQSSQIQKVNELLESGVFITIRHPCLCRDADVRASKEQASNSATLDQRRLIVKVALLFYSWPRTIKLTL